MEYNINSCKHIIKDFIRDIIKEYNIDYWDEWLEEQDYELLMKYPNILVSCEEDNKLIGICSIRVTSNNAAYLNSFYIIKEYRHLWIGSKLYNICEDYVKSNKYKRIDLVVDPNFKNAIEFYKKRNYIYDKYDDKRKEIYYHKNI